MGTSNAELFMYGIIGFLTVFAWILLYQYLSIILENTQASYNFLFCPQFTN